MHNSKLLLPQAHFLARIVFLLLIIVFICWNNIWASDFNTTLDKAKTGNANTQYLLAQKYLSGNEVVKNYDLATEFLIKAAKQNYKDAIDDLHSYRYLAKELSKENFAELLNLADSGEFVWAYHLVGRAYLWGCGVERDYGEALKWFSKGAEKGDYWSQSEIDKYYENGVIIFDEGTIIKQAEAGSADAMRSLIVYYSTKRLDQNEFLKWLTILAETGDSYACLQLGTIYLQGNFFMAQNYVEAEKWLKRAVGQGNEYAYYKLAQIYVTEESGLLNYDKAVTLYEKLMKDADDFDAKYLGKLGLAKLYIDENFHKHNYIIAAQMFEELIEQKEFIGGNVLYIFGSDVYYQLGVLYQNGRGVSKNQTKACELYTKTLEISPAHWDAYLAKIENCD